jgi:hypothetical protein
MSLRSPIVATVLAYCLSLMIKFLFKAKESGCSDKARSAAIAVKPARFRLSRDRLFIGIESIMSRRCVSLEEVEEEAPGFPAFVNMLNPRCLRGSSRASKVFVTRSKW